MDVTYYKYSHCVHSNVTKLQAWLYAWVHVHGYGYVHGRMCMAMCTAMATGMASCAWLRLRLHACAWPQLQSKTSNNGTDTFLFYTDFLILIHQYIIKTIQL